MDLKRQEEERRRITQKYGSPIKHQEFDPNTSRYLEYRKQEKLRQEKVDNPEKFMTKEQPVIEVPQHSIEPLVYEPSKKKSWFLKLFKK